GAAGRPTRPAPRSAPDRPATHPAPPAGGAVTSRPRAPRASPVRVSRRPPRTRTDPTGLTAGSASSRQPVDPNGRAGRKKGERTPVSARNRGIGVGSYVWQRSENHDANPSPEQA